MQTPILEIMDTDGNNNTNMLINEFQLIETMLNELNEVWSTEPNIERSYLHFDQKTAIKNMVKEFQSLDVDIVTCIPHLKVNAATKLMEKLHKNNNNNRISKRRRKYVTKNSKRKGKPLDLMKLQRAKFRIENDIPNVEENIDTKETRLNKAKTIELNIGNIHPHGNESTRIEPKPKERNRVKPIELNIGNILRHGNESTRIEPKSKELNKVKPIELNIGSIHPLSNETTKIEPMVEEQNEFQTVESIIESIRIEVLMRIFDVFPLGEINFDIVDAEVKKLEKTAVEQKEYWATESDIDSIFPNLDEILAADEMAQDLDKVQTAASNNGSSVPLLKENNSTKIMEPSVSCPDNGTTTKNIKPKIKRTRKPTKEPSVSCPDDGTSTRNIKKKTKKTRKPTKKQSLKNPNVELSPRPSVKMNDKDTTKEPKVKNLDSHKAINTNGASPQVEERTVEKIQNMDSHTASNTTSSIPQVEENTTIEEHQVHISRLNSKIMDAEVDNIFLEQMDEESNQFQPIELYNGNYPYDNESNTIDTMLKELSDHTETYTENTFQYSDEMTAIEAMVLDIKGSQNTEVDMESSIPPLKENSTTEEMLQELVGEPKVYISSTVPPVEVNRLIESLKRNLPQEQKEKLNTEQNDAVLNVEENTTADATSVKYYLMHQIPLVIDEEVMGNIILLEPLEMDQSKFNRLTMESTYQHGSEITTMVQDLNSALGTEANTGNCVPNLSDNNTDELDELNELSTLPNVDTTIDSLLQDLTEIQKEKLNTPRTVHQEQSLRIPKKRKSNNKKNVNKKDVNTEPEERSHKAQNVRKPKRKSSINIKDATTVIETKKRKYVNPRPRITKDCMLLSARCIDLPDHTMLHRQ